MNINTAFKKCVCVCVCGGGGGGGGGGIVPCIPTPLLIYFLRPKTAVYFDNHICLVSRPRDKTFFRDL